MPGRAQRGEHDGRLEAALQLGGAPASGPSSATPPRLKNAGIARNAAGGGNGLVRAPFCAQRRIPPLLDGSLRRPATSHMPMKYLDRGRAPGDAHRPPPLCCTPLVGRTTQRRSRRPWRPFWTWRSAARPGGLCGEVAPARQHTTRARVARGPLSARRAERGWRARRGRMAPTSAQAAGPPRQPSRSSGMWRCPRPKCTESRGPRQTTFCR